MKNKKKIIALIIVIAFIVTGIIAVYLYKNRYAEKITPSAEITADNLAAFYQKDDLWKNDSLGESEYHMGDSGCLTTCIASVLLMQNISVDEIPDITPGTLNEFFSNNNVYDEEGNLQWDAAGSALNVTFIKKETSEISQTELENLIERNVYPIVCVKMPSSGNYHFVLLVGSDEQSFLCMDPLNKDKNIVSMDKFSDTIYSVRYCENIIPDETIENTQIIDENEYYKVMESDNLYYYEIYDENNNIVKSDGPLNREPHLSMSDEHTVKFTLQAGTGISTQWGFYYDTENDRFSDTFYSIFDEYNGRMIFRDREKIIVRDIFDKSKYYYEIDSDSYTNPLLQSSEPFSKVQFVNNGESIEITYLSNDYHEVTEVFDLP